MTYRRLEASLASLVAQLVKNSPAMWETKKSMDYTVHGVAKSWTRLSDFHFTLVVQKVKSLHAKQETRVRSLGWEDPLE